MKYKQGEKMIVEITEVKENSADCIKEVGEQFDIMAGEQNE